MPDPRYVVQAVVRREGDAISGTFLGRATTLAEAFTVAGAALERDQGPAGRNLLYVIRDEEDGRAWTVIENFG